MVVAKIATTTQHEAMQGKTQTTPTNYYNLDAIISVGYRVNSIQATQFRIWATDILKEYMIKGFAMDNIDSDTLKRYRIMVNSWNPQHVWRELPDKEFLEMLGGYRRDRREKVEGLTVAGLLMFGTGLAIRDEFDNIFMDYRNETDADDETRWVAEKYIICWKNETKMYGVIYAKDFKESKRKIMEWYEGVQFRKVEKGWYELGHFGL